jgi:hypothetical protein
MPDGSNWTIPRENLLRAKTRGAVEIQEASPEGTLKKIGRGAALGAFSGAGVAETLNPVKDTLKGLRDQLGNMMGAAAWRGEPDALKKTVMANPLVAIPHALGTTGADVVKDVVPGMRGGMIPGIDLKNIDPEKLSHDLSALVTQILMLKGGKKAATTPLAESEALKGAVKAGELPPKIVRNVTGTKYATEQAQAAAAKIMEKYNKEKLERENEVAEQKKAKEARDTEALKNAKTGQIDELSRARSELNAATAKQVSTTKKMAKQYQKELAAKQSIEADNAKIESQKKNLEQTVQQKSKEFTDNTNKVIAEGKKHFDARYGEFDRKILGKTETNPKGLAQSSLTKFAKGVENAKKNLIEGSPEKIKQFESILTLSAKEGAIDLGQGEIMIGSGQFLPTVDLRGFNTELQNAIYNRDLLPDVRTALKSVLKIGQDEVMATVKDIGGDTAVKSLEELNSDYSDYLTDWRDTSAVNPLPKIRDKLLEGVVQKNPKVLADLDLTGSVKAGNKGQTALTLLEKYRKFGADPEILRTYQKSVEQLKALDKLKKVPEVSKPEYPAAAIKAPPSRNLNLPEPPKIEPFTPRGKDPEAPEPFNRNQFIQDTLKGRLNTAGRWGSGMMLLRSIYDVTHGNFAGAASSAEEIAAIQAIKSLLTSPKVIEYLSKEAP